MKKSEAEQIVREALKSFDAVTTPVARKVRAKLNGALAILREEWSEPAAGPSTGATPPAEPPTTNA